MARKIQGPDQARRALDENQRFLLIPGVVAERDRIRTGIDELLVDRLGDPETAGGILAIDDNEIERPVLDHARQMFGYCGAAGLADDVTDKEDTQISAPEIEHFLFR